MYVDLGMMHKRKIGLFKQDIVTPNTQSMVIKYFSLAPIAEVVILEYNGAAL